MYALPDLDRWRAPEFYDTSIANTRRDIGREIAGLLAGRVLPDTCPVEVLESARFAFAARYPLWACVHAYRAGHAVQWQAYSDAVEARQLDREARRLVLQAGSDYMFTYADLCSRWMEREYTLERDRWLRSEEQKRIQVVRDLLEGKAAESGPAGYRLDGWHVALVAEGREAEASVRSLSQRLGGETLILTGEPAVWWGWARVCAPALDRHWASVPVAAETWLAIGEPGQGAPGFRSSHQQAQDALAVGRRRRQSATRYHDVALEALATADLDQARAFVARELRSLAANDQRAETLRATLSAYFSASQRASSAAAVLGVHERTIGNRLRAVEDIIGRPVQTRRAELELALRIWDLV
jgi:hypothetical protein